MSQLTHFSPSVAPRGGGRAGRSLGLRLFWDRLLWAERSLPLLLLPGLAAIAATALVETYVLSGMERGSALFAFFPAVVLASLLGRLPGGLLAALLPVMLVGVWMVPFQGMPNPGEILPYSSACLAVIALSEALHRAHSRAFAAARESAEYQTVAAALSEREARLARLTREEAQTFYAEHTGKPFFVDLVEYMTSGPVMLVCLEREGAVEGPAVITGTGGVVSIVKLPEASRIPCHQPSSMLTY